MKKQNTWAEGNPQTGKHYWLSPNWLWKRVAKILGTTRDGLYDPCPYPRTENYNGIAAEWGRKTYVNPPFGVVNELMDGKIRKIGTTAWVRKAVKESHNGKDVVIVLPIDSWIRMLLDEKAEMVYMGDVRWESTEDRSTINGSSRPIMAFILKGKKRER